MRSYRLHAGIADIQDQVAFDTIYDILLQSCTSSQIRTDTV